VDEIIDLSTIFLSFFSLFSRTSIVPSHVMINDH